MWEENREKTEMEFGGRHSIQLSYARNVREHYAVLKQAGKQIRVPRPGSERWAGSRKRF